MFVGLIRLLLKRSCTYAFVEFSPVLVRAGVCPALILGVHANLGRVLSGEGPEIIALS